MNIAGSKIRERRLYYGMTLQILSDRLADIGMNVSMLHRIETGVWKTKAPDDVVIERIAKVLALDAKRLKADFEQDKQAKARARTVEESEIVVPLTDAVDFSRLQRLMLRDKRERSYAFDAAAEAEKLDRRLENWIEQAPTQVARDTLLLEKAYLNIEKANIYADSLSARQAAKRGKLLVDEQRSIANAVRTALASETLNFSYQGLLYVRNEHSKALQFRVEDYSVFPDAYLRLAARRVTASNLAFIGETSKSLKEAQGIRATLDSGEISDPYLELWALDALGRVYAISKHRKTFSLFEEAWGYYEIVKEERGRSRLREIQLAVTQLSAVVTIDPANITLANDLARRGRDAARNEEGVVDHPRHLQKLEKLMKSLHGT